MQENYSNREIDLMFKDIHEKLDAILVQVTNINGKVARNKAEINKLKFILAIVGTAVGTVLVMNGNDLINFLMKII